MCDICFQYYVGCSVKKDHDKHFDEDPIIIIQTRKNKRKCKVPFNLFVSRTDITNTVSRILKGLWTDNEKRNLVYFISADRCYANVLFQTLFISFKNNPSHHELYSSFGINLHNTFQSIFIYLSVKVYASELQLQYDCLELKL